MSSKKSFKIKSNPTFKSAVKIPRVGSEPLDVTFEFKSFPRKELARIFDSWAEQNQKLIDDATEAKDSGEPFNLEKWADREIELQVKQVKDITSGWGFEEEFTDENIEELVSTSVSVTGAIIDQYNEAYTRARSGN